MTLDRESYFFTPRYTRGQVCKSLGITRDTLRHYEQCGLLSPEVNEKNGYKYYSIADLEILNVILFLRAMEVSIQDIPKFIQCKDTDKYGSFLEEQIAKANNKINYWNHVKDILSYLKETLEDYKNASNNVTLVENTTFRFRVVKFDYKNYDISKMLPSKISNEDISHVIKLKIVDEKWILSNREDTSEIITGHLCGEDEIDKDISISTIPLSLMLSTLENLEKIPSAIIKTWDKFKDKYEFSSRVYIVEHTFFNIFNQEALLRNIYLPIVNIK